MIRQRLQANAWGRQTDEKLAELNEGDGRELLEVLSKQESIQGEEKAVRDQTGNE